MRALPPDIAERLRAEAVDLDPEHVEIFDRAQDLQIALGLSVEVEVKQDVDVGASAIADGLEMHAKVAQHLSINIDLGKERRPEAGPPAGRLAVVIGEDVGLECRELLLAHFAPDRLHAVETFDGRLVPARVIDAPGCAM